MPASALFLAYATKKIRAAEGKLVRAWVKAPVVVEASSNSFEVPTGEVVLQRVPLCVRVPVTVPPKVAPVVEIPVTVGAFTVGAWEYTVEANNTKKILLNMSMVFLVVILWIKPTKQFVINFRSY